MWIWPYLTMLCSAAAVAVAYPLIRRYESSLDRAARDVAVYRDQLAEVQSDVLAGNISAVDATQASQEIQRRLAAASKSIEVSRPLSPLWRNLVVAATVAFVIVGSVNLYGVLGRPELPSAPPQQASITPNQTAAPEIPQVGEMIVKLQERLKTDSKNAEGWRMLGWAYFNVQNFGGSAEAYNKAVTLDPDNLDYISSYAEALVQVADGTVTAEAQTLIAKVLAKQPTDNRARFYDAMAREQAGDNSGALDRWTSLLADTSADAPWREAVVARVQDLGKTLGRDVTAALAVPKVAVEQDENSAMIDGMIAKLTQKLVDNPQDAQGWGMLIRSLTVRGDQAAADQALAEALVVFKDEPATIASLKDIAKQALKNIPN